MRIRKRLPENLGLIEKVSESNMEKLYWVSAIIQGYNNKKPWLCAMNEGQINFDESMSIINRLRDNYDVLSAWIDTFDVSGEKKTVYHDCYINAFGDLSHR